MNKLRATLIDVGSPRKEVNEPSGIETIAGHARANVPGVDIHLSSVQIDGTESIDASILANKELIGISTKINTLQRTDDLVHQIQQVSATGQQSPLIVMGDLYPTFAPQQMAERYPDVISVRGEGETAFIGILEAIREVRGGVEEVKHQLMEQDVPNIVMQINGKVVATTRTVFDLNTSVLQARDLTKEVIKMGGIVRADASRGCPWGRCHFCGVTSKYGGINWRTFPVEKVVNELAAISDTGAKSPHFNDEDFIGTNPDRATELADQIILAKQQERIDPDLNFSFNMRVITLLGEKIGGEERARAMMLRLKQAGLREVFLGIESGAKGQMKRYVKDSTAQKNIRAIKILAELGIDMDLGFIMFDPEMSFADLAHNIQFAHSAGIQDHDANLVKKLRVQPQTKLGERCVTKGIVVPQLDLDSLTYSYNFQDPRVQKVYDTFSQWEASCSDYLYQLQALSRGEVESEQFRTKCKKLLGGFRALDLMYLKTLVETGTVDEKAFQTTRNDLIQHAISELDGKSKVIDDIHHHPE